MRCRVLSVLLSVILCLTVFSSCAYYRNGEEMGPKLGEAQKGGTIRISCEHPDTLNPLKTQIQSNYNMLMLVFEGLFLVQSNQQAVPVLADGYTVSDDGLEYVISLKQNIKFHDGKIFGAKDVIYTMNNMDKYCPKYASMFDNIEIFYPLGNDKIVIKLFEPVINFVNSLTFPILSEITPLSAFDGMDTEFIPVGTGEFMFESGITRSELTLKRNPKWHKDSGYIDSVNVIFVDNIQTAMNSFNSNVIDILTTNEFRWGDFSFVENYKTYEYENSVYEYIGFNADNPIFTSLNVRKAIYTAIDRNYITEEIMMSHAEPSYIPVAKGSYFYPDAYKSKVPDKDAIKSLLDSDGWVDVDADDVYEKNIGKENYELSFKLLINADEMYSSAIADSISAALKGYKISVETVSLPSSEYDQAYKKGDYDLILAKTYMDSGNFLKNMPGSLSDKMKNQINGMAVLKDQEQFKNEMSELCDMFVAEFPHIPLFFETSAIFCKNNIKGTPSPAYSWVYNGITDLFVNTKGGSDD